MNLFFTAYRATEYWNIYSGLIAISLNNDLREMLENCVMCDVFIDESQNRISQSQNFVISAIKLRPRFYFIKTEKENIFNHSFLTYFTGLMGLKMMD